MPRAWRPRAAPLAGCAVAVALAGLGCGRIGFAELDVVTIDAGEQPGPCGPWSTPIRLVDVSSPATEWAPAVDPTGLVLVFSSNRGTGFDLYLSRRASPGDSFGPATRLSISGASDETGAAFSPDGALYFNDDVNLYRAAPDGAGGFEAPAVVTAPGFAIDITSDGLELFTSDVADDSLDVVHAVRAAPSESWNVVDDLDLVNRVGLDEGWPSFDEREQTLYFERGDTPDGNSDLARATRPGPGLPFSVAAPIPELDVFGVWYADPEVTRDGMTMLFSADISGATEFDLYQVTRDCPP